MNVLKITRLEPCKVASFHVRDSLTPEHEVFDLFENCCVVVEAFDLASDKAMIVKCFKEERFKDKYLVCASGLAGIHSSNLVETRRLARNVYVCGDFVHEPGADQGLMAPRVMIAAGHEANMVVRIICGEWDP